MRIQLLPVFLLLTGCSLAADPGAEAPKAEYVDEAPLPEGWPKPGPYGEVVEKQLPAYRAAFTTGKGETRAFWTLFGHIQKNDIPMTAPVEMAMAEQDGELEQSSMGFLYQNTEVGATGPDGDKVEVRDVPAAKVLSYAWQGPDSEANIVAARKELESALADKELEPQGFRLLGYNGPGTPRDRKTWELQAVLEGAP